MNLIDVVKYFGTQVNAATAASDVLNALIARGYSDKEAHLAVKQLPEGLSLSDGIRQALKSLARG